MDTSMLVWSMGKKVLQYLARADTTIIVWPSNMSKMVIFNFQFPRASRVIA